VRDYIHVRTADAQTGAKIDVWVGKPDVKNWAASSVGNKLELVTAAGDPYQHPAHSKNFRYSFLVGSSCSLVSAGILAVSGAVVWRAAVSSAAGTVSSGAGALDVLRAFAGVVFVPPDRR